MIEIKFKGNDTEKVKEVKEKLHYALVGTRAYIDSEIAICDASYSTTLDPSTRVTSSSENTFFLVIGDTNGKEVGIELDVNDIDLEEISVE